MASDKKPAAKGKPADGGGKKPPPQPQRPKSDTLKKVHGSEGAAKQRPRPGKAKPKPAPRKDRG